MSPADIGFAVILGVIAIWHLACKYLNLKYGPKNEEKKD